MINSNISFKNNPGLFNNATYKAAALSSRSMAGILQRRYLEMERTLVPRVLDVTGGLLPDSPAVHFITMYGSAASFRHYNDVDLSVGISGQIDDAVVRDLAFKDESGSVVRPVEMFFYDISDIDPKDNIRFIFGKPLLSGKAPEIPAGELPGLLNWAISDVIKIADERLQCGNIRKAIHALLAVNRHLMAYRDLSGSPAPKGCVSFIRSVYRMDAKDSYPPGEVKSLLEDLTRIRSEIVIGGPCLPPVEIPPCF